MIASITRSSPGANVIFTVMPTDPLFIECRDNDRKGHGL
jgi:hypothetical protein